ncbi:unnamed protein product [Lampetra planeri]
MRSTHAIPRGKRDERRRIWRPPPCLQHLASPRCRHRASALTKLSSAQLTRSKMRSMEPLRGPKQTHADSTGGCGVHGGNKKGRPLFAVFCRYIIDRKGPSLFEPPRPYLHARGADGSGGSRGTGCRRWLLASTREGGGGTPHCRACDVWTTQRAQPPGSGLPDCRSVACGSSANAAAALLCCLGDAARSVLVGEREGMSVVRVGWHPVPELEAQWPNAAPLPGPLRL